MNRLLSVLLATVLICVIFVPTQTFAQVSITIDRVDSLYNGKIQPDMPIDMYLRWANNSGERLCVFSGYRIYLSNNGELPNGVFEPVTIEGVNLNYSEMFDLIFAEHNFSNGFGSDTVAISGIVLSSPGFPDGLDTIAARISTSVSADFAGDSLCVDSTFYGQTGVWQWSLAIDVIPDWGGPYCYEILPSCCIGQRGNFNNSPGINPIDIADLARMVSFMFLNGVAPTCDEEADFTGDGSLDVSDLVGLVDYMHFNGSPPADCP